MSSPPRYHFTTRDLLMMAALAGLGGIAGTYVNALGDVVQAGLGFPGASQWAAGLHVLWLTLAVGLTGKAGAGTVTGALKGGVELLTGNTHGVIVLLIDVAAGVLVDLGALPFRRKDSPWMLALSGGLAAISNVLIFQLFASLPADSLAMGALAVVAGLSCLSGVLFGGVGAHLLLRTLRRTGVVRDLPPAPARPGVVAVALVLSGLLGVGVGLYLHRAIPAPGVVSVEGAVHNPFRYPERGDAEGGIRLGELVERAGPREDAAAVLIRASDGYEFALSMDEVRTSETLRLEPQGTPEEPSFGTVGASTRKAEVRGVAAIVVQTGADGGGT